MHLFRIRPGQRNVRRIGDMRLPRLARLGAWFFLMALLGACASSSAPRGAESAFSPSSETTVTRQQVQGSQVIDMRAGEYFFQPDALVIRPGPVRVQITNAGERIHSFSVKDGRGRDVVTSDRTPPGGSATIDFTLMEEGTYEYYCP